MVMKWWSAAPAILAAVGLIATPAQAHPKMTKSVPAANVTLNSAPTEIKIDFNEAIIVRFSGLNLRDSQNREIPTGKASLAPSDKTKVLVPIKQRLKAGIYHVAWHVVSVDTHRISGNYAFKVAR